MSETVKERAALALEMPAGTFGKSVAEPGLIATEITGLALASILAFKGKDAEIAALVRDKLGLDLPQTGKRVANDAVSISGVGPRQWLVTIANMPAGRIEGHLSFLNGLAAVSEQSDARAVLHLTGLRVRSVLAKGLMLDLHPRVFQTGDVAQTPVGGIGVQIAQIDDAPTYEISFARSFAGSFVHWLAESASEFGYRVDPPRG